MTDKKPEDVVLEAFAEFKQANDANLKKRDVVLEDKLNKISAKLDEFEPMNQQLTLAQSTIKAQQEQMDRFEAALNRPGPGGQNDADRHEFRNAFDRAIRMRPEERAPEDVATIKRYATLVKSDDTGAGYLLAPPDLQRDIIKDLVEMTPFRALATVVNIGGPSLKQPKRTGTASATRVGETQLRTNTGDPAYGMIDIPAPEMFARMEVSQQMLEDSGYDLLAELRSEVVEQFSVKEGQEYILGLGNNNQAEGVLVAAGIGETVSGNATAITGDGLISLYYDMKTAYSRNAIWGMNRVTVGAIRKLKDGQGNYLWQPGIAANVPNTILGAAYAEMPDMPNIAANAFPVIFGDFRRAYVIVDRISIGFSVDYNTAADNGVVIFRSRKRTGGGVRLPQAIRKLKIST